MMGCGYRTGKGERRPALAHAWRKSARPRTGLHDQALHNADEKGGSGRHVQIGRCVATLHGRLEQAQQQLAVALHETTHPLLERRVRRLLKFMKDNARYAGVGYDKIHMGIKHAAQGVKGHLGPLRRFVQRLQQMLRHPGYGRQPDCIFGRKVFKQRPLAQTHGTGQVGGGDERRTVVLRQAQCRSHDLGLASLSRETSKGCKFHEHPPQFGN